jgi:hypothetical protein
MVNGIVKTARLKTLLPINLTKKARITQERNDGSINVGNPQIRKSKIT